MIFRFTSDVSKYHCPISNDWNRYPTDINHYLGYLYIYIWRFPKMGVPLNHPILIGFSMK